MEQRISLVTLGVADVTRARTFYERLGWQGQEVEETVFFQAGGIALVLWGRDKLAEDVGVEDRNTDGFGGMSLAHNVRSRAEVDEVLGDAASAGAEITQTARETFYGGYAGYLTAGAASTRTERRCRCRPAGATWHRAGSPRARFSTFPFPDEPFPHVNDAAEFRRVANHPHCARCCRYSPRRRWPRPPCWHRACSSSAAPAVRRQHVRSTGFRRRSHPSGREAALVIAAA